MQLITLYKQCSASTSSDNVEKKKNENEKCLFSNTQEFYITFLVIWFE